jgi:hypothetical protein
MGVSACVKKEIACAFGERLMMAAKKFGADTAAACGAAKVGAWLVS